MYVKFLYSRKMHSSFFDYNISRPYPFKWFTPLALIVIAIAAIPISIINLGSNGYFLAAQYSHDPNATVSERPHNNWPSFWITKFRPTCQSANIPINTRLLTNNTALTYTLTSVVQKAEANQTFSSSLVYHNNVLSDCTIDHIAVRLESTGRTATQIGLSNWGVDAQAFISCNLDTDDQGLTTFNLTAEYNFIPETVSVYAGFYKFVGRNKTAKASLYWGESLLSTYSLHLGRDASISNFSGKAALVSKGVITFTPNNRSPTDLINLNFFDVLFRFIAPTPDNLWGFDDGESMPNISSNSFKMDFWSSVDTFAKSFYSTVLTDLGQTSSHPNILTDAILLEHFTTNFSSIISTQMSRGSSVPEPAQEPFNTLNATETLGINPSVLAATYLCAVPRKKPTGTLIVSVLAADLVFLHSLFKVLNLVVRWWVKRKDRQAHVCEGCLEGKELLDDSDEVPLRPMRVSQDGSYESVPVGP